MTLVRWEPFRNVASLQDRINRMFDDAFNKARDIDENAMGAWRPSVDIFETETAIVLEAELPGVTRDDITVEVENNVLSLKGERREIREVEEERYYRRERIVGRFHRAFTLPVDVNHEQIKANFQNGILRLEVPKPEEKKPKKIAIQVEN
ncbi:HSP20 family protein [Desulfobotulus alkaliphilus]|uniref:HSP20 family protein n=1 Tax=Desulfobotulus alkaliphilus TaxID=622671 RepID=A0A562S2I3_9BACT|nr:Hsp20/alpha crystallin family protein [Desulfobotulus alkaliphilus]TWI75348.1 HSP20 family protein [Desulfobotulus alkaliphilus]